MQGKRIQSWLNGVAVIDAEIGSAHWQARVAKSKFAKSPEFAASPAAVIVLQDHGNPVGTGRFASGGCETASMPG